MLQKTNVCRLLDQAGIPYRLLQYNDKKAVSGREVAAALNEPIECLFKTLVTEGKSGEHYVFDIPSDRELDLKKGAKAVGEKAIHMIPQKDLLRLTGYVHGGCSPIGMKHEYPTVFHETAEILDYVVISGGKRGVQVVLKADDLQALLDFRYADVATDTISE